MKFLKEESGTGWTYTNELQRVPKVTAPGCPFLLAIGKEGVEDSLPPSPLRIVEDEEYETTQEYEPAQEPVKKLTNSSRRAKRTKPNGYIAHRLEMDNNTGADSSNSESETEDERVGWHHRLNVL